MTDLQGTKAVHDRSKTAPRASDLPHAHGGRVIESQVTRKGNNGGPPNVNCDII